MSDQMSLTEKDYELLAEALDVWEKDPISKALKESMLTAVMVGRPAKDDLDRTMREGESKAAGRKRISVILRAKVELARQAAQNEAIAAAGGQES